MSARVDTHVFSFSFGDNDTPARLLEREGRVDASVGEIFRSGHQNGTKRCTQNTCDRGRWPSWLVRKLYAESVRPIHDQRERNMLDQSITGSYLTFADFSVGALAKAPVDDDRTRARFTSRWPGFCLFAGL